MVAVGRQGRGRPRCIWSEAVTEVMGDRNSPQKDTESREERKVGAEDPYVAGKPLRRRKSHKTLKIIICWGWGVKRRFGEFKKI
jgi:hypothetical protein